MIAPDGTDMGPIGGTGSVNINIRDRQAPSRSAVLPITSSAGVVRADEVPIVAKSYTPFEDGYPGNAEAEPDVQGQAIAALLGGPESLAAAGLRPDAAYIGLGMADKALSQGKQWTQGQASDLGGWGLRQNNAVGNAAYATGAVINTAIELFQPASVGQTMLLASTPVMSTTAQAGVRGLNALAGKFASTRFAAVDIAPYASRLLGRQATAPTSNGVGSAGSLEPFFEILTESPITGTTRRAHRASANLNFARQLQTDPAYASAMNREFGVDVLAHMQSGKSALKNPPGTEWHHPKSDPYTMWLLRRNVHRDPALQDYLHAGNSGGFAEYYGE